ncbi:RHS repeat protein [Photobacterium kishitanii]|uniref:RHS repeat-associated core domain-containing protein n=1 Tax=Photobacterium kishitanii TaxID=318456 RepID=UPI0009BDB1A4|nr:RHS repeat-associated core domain-containing protein [Photobacterium kishitanii]PSW70860.1 RHS repeat protein [Photobacterium kishitanii]
MNKKARAVLVIKKIKEIIDITKVDAIDNIDILKKVTQHGHGKFNACKKATQTIDGKHHEGATSEKRSAKQSTHITSEKRRDIDNRSSTNEKGDSTQGTCKDASEGCPVSMVTGEETLQLNDVTLPGALPYTFSRTYKTSNCELNLGLGYGWSHPLSQSLIFKAGKLFWKDAEGKRTQLPEPTESRPEIYNDLAEAAVFLGEKENEYVLAQSGQPFHHFTRKGDTAQLTALSDKYSNRLTIQYDRYQRPQAVINGLGIALWFVYQNSFISAIEFRTLKTDDLNKEWITERTSFTYQYNDNHQLVKALNTAGEGEYYQYDEANVISLRKMAGGVEFGWQWEGIGKNVRCAHHWSNTGYDTTFAWDDASHTVNITYSDGSTATYQHDKNAKLIEKIDPDGAVTKNEFNENGDLTLTIDPLGNETRHVYNEFQQRVLTIQPDGETIEFQYWRGTLRRVIQGEQNWRYKYSAQGDITEKRDPLGQDTFYRYNGQGQLAEIVYPDGSKHKLVWNRLGMMLGETYPDGSRISYRYDIFGRIVEEKAPTGATTRYVWDDADRLAEIMLPNGSRKQYRYNAYGKITQSIDENGAQTVYEYAANSHLVSRVIHPDGSTLSYQYNNAKGFVSQIINENGNSYLIDYYPNGLVKQETTFDDRQLRYQYDLNSNLTSKTDVGKQGTELTTTYTRDVMGRLLTKVLPDGVEIQYQYDKQGQLIGIDDGVTPLAWQYDPLGRLTAEHQGWASQYYRYDQIGQLTHWQLPDHNVLEYGRAKGGSLEQITLNDQLLTRHDYQQGLEVYRQQGDIQNRFSYDDQGRLRRHLQHQQDHTVSSRDYYYNVVGNLSKVNDSRYGVTHYEYDPLDRLKSAKGPLEEAFTHDPAGNLLEQTLGSSIGRTKSLVTNNQLLLQGDAHFEYDEFGCLTVEKRGKDQCLVTQYEYDCQHRLTQAKMSDGSTARYVYDAFGRRVSKTVVDKRGQSTTTEFVWQGDNLVAEERNGGDYQTYVYEPGSFKPLALLKGEGKACVVYHYHLDHLGTPIDLTDEQGNTVWQAQYCCYGNIAVQHVEKIVSPLRFQGQYYDNETGLHYNRHRYYSPKTGRFTTIDPIGLAGGLNNYQYVPNPLNWVDPLGLVSIPGDCICSPDASVSNIDKADNWKAENTPPSVVKAFGKYSVGPYNELKGKVLNLDAHHAAQKAVMKKLIDNYDPITGPSILVPKVGHTIKGPNGIVSRNTKGIYNARDLLARDVKELRRVYSDIPNIQLKNLISLNKEMYPLAFKR